MTSVEKRESLLLTGTTVVIACREIDIARQVATSAALGAHHVVVDLGAVEMVDSSTLTALKRVAGRLRSRGGRMSVVCEHPGLAGLLHLTLLSRSFQVFSSLDGALRTTP